MSQDLKAGRLTARARELRREETLAEKELWRMLRGRAFRGLKFRRQAPLLGYIADFYCPQLRLVIELDGGIHDTVEQRLRDENRDADLEAHGYTVLHIRNAEVLERPESVVQRLEAWLAR